MAQSNKTAAQIHVDCALTYFMTLTISDTTHQNSDNKFAIKQWAQMSKNDVSQALLQCNFMLARITAIKILENEQVCFSTQK